MFWNKRPKGYVETVDGYLIRKEEAKKVIYRGVDCFSGQTFIEELCYRKENAPAYDETSKGKYFWKNSVPVKEDGTPIGYYSKEEFDLLNNRIAELQEELSASYCGESSYKNVFDHVVKNIKSGYIGEIAGEELYVSKSKKAGRPKKNK